MASLIIKFLNGLWLGWMIQLTMYNWYRVIHYRVFFLFMHFIYKNILKNLYKHSLRNFTWDFCHFSDVCTNEQNTDQ